MGRALPAQTSLRPIPSTQVHQLPMTPTLAPGLAMLATLPCRTAATSAAQVATRPQGI